MNKVYQIITDRIIESLKDGKVPWHRPWTGGGTPCNAVSKKPYRGVNVFMTAMAGYSSPYWMTFNQCRDMGGMVRKGEKSTPIIFWKIDIVKDEDDEEKIRKNFILRYYNVFNAEQCDGLPEDLYPAPAKAISDPEVDKAGQAVLKSYADKPKINTGKGGAYYRPSDDSIGIPNRSDFDDLQSYWAVLFHELTHSTGASRRLDRDMGAINSSYSYEELIAELGSAFLCAESGIGNEAIGRNNVAYLQGWLSALGSNPEWIIKASAAASKAVDYMLGKQAAEGVAA